LPLEVSTDGSFDAEYQGLSVGDIVCVQAVTFDLDSINDVLNFSATLCPLLDIIQNDQTLCMNISVLGSGANDGNPGISNFEEVILFAQIFSGNTILSLSHLAYALNQLNNVFYGFGTAVCFAFSNSICISVTSIDCAACAQILNLAGTISTGTYAADDIIISSGQVNNYSGGPVTFEAGANPGGIEYIELISNFEANGMVNFVATNIECDTTD